MAYVNWSLKHTANITVYVNASSLPIYYNIYVLNIADIIHAPHLRTLHWIAA